MLDRLNTRQRITLGVSVAYDVLLLVLLGCSASIVSIATLFFFGIVGILFQIILIASIQYVWFSDQDELSPKRIGGLLLISLCGGILLEGGTVFGSAALSVLAITDWSGKRIIFFVFLTYAVVALILIAKRFYSETGIKALFLSLNSRDGIIYLFGIVLGTLSALTIHALLSVSLFPSFIFFELLFLCIASLIVSFLHRVEIHIVFSFFALAIGLALALIPPAISLICWDDQIHFARAESISYVINPTYSEGDADLALAAYSYSDYLPDWSESSIIAYNERINTAQFEGVNVSFGCKPIADAKETDYVYSSYTLSSFGYLPYAVGLWLGRFLHMNLTDIFVLGRVFGLIFYVAICFFAIRLIPVKKTLLALVALIPTSLFLSASYSNDGWLNSMMLLSVAMAIKLIYEKGPISAWEATITLIVFFLALAPKPVYFPLIGLLLFIPRERFGSKRAKSRWNAIVLGLCVLALASFAVPFISQGEYGDDLRGGGDVNSREQIKFILQHPGAFSRVIASEFFNVFWNPAYSGNAFVNFAYLGSLVSRVPALNMVPCILLLFCAVSDNFGVPKGLFSIPRKLWTALFVIGASVLIFTSLYVSFNGVGSTPRNTDGIVFVSGVQSRYLLPLLFPTLAIVASMKLSNHYDLLRYSYIMQGLMAFVGFAATFFLVLRPMVVG